MKLFLFYYSFLIEFFGIFLYGLLYKLQVFYFYFYHLNSLFSKAIVRQEDFSKINKYFQQTCITLHVLLQIIWLKEIIQKVIMKKNKNKKD